MSALFLCLALLLSFSMSLSQSSYDYNMESLEYDQMGLGWMRKPRMHQIFLDGSGNSYKSRPINPYQEVLEGKWSQNPFQKLFVYRKKVQQLFNGSPWGDGKTWGPDWGPNFGPYGDWGRGLRFGGQGRNGNFRPSNFGSYYRRRAMKLRQ